MKEGTSRARAWAICHTKSAASSLYLPPVSMAISTNRQRLDATSSGYFASFSRLAWSSTAPSTSAACGCGSPSLLKTPRRVMSIASLKLELDANPGLSANSRKHLLGGCGPHANSSRACARCSVAPQEIKRFLTSVAPCVADGLPTVAGHQKPCWSSTVPT